MNRADAIELDELAKSKECKKCLGIDASRLSIAERRRRQSDLIEVGEFLMKVIGSNPATDTYAAAEKKLLNVVESL